jgi:hypothetical protein
MSQDAPHGTQTSVTDTTRRHLLAIATGGAVAAAIPTADAHGPVPGQAADPIYAAIEKHKAACIPWDAAIDARAEFPESADPMTDKQWEQRDALDDAVDDTREPLVDAGVNLVCTKPTTLAGVIAAISYVRAQMRDDGTYMPYASEFESGFEYTEGSAGDSRDTMGWIDAFLDTIADAAAALAEPVQS